MSSPIYCLFVDFSHCVCLGTIKFLSKNIISATLQNVNWEKKSKETWD